MAAASKEIESLDKAALESTYDATASDKIRISDDKLWRYLKEYERPVKLLAYLSASITIAISLLATLLSSDFKSGKTKFLFEASTWQVLFTAGFVAATVIFLLNLCKLIYLFVCNKWMTTDSLIKKIKREAFKDN